MISPDRISIALPQTAQDVYGIAQDVLLVMQAMPDYDPLEYEEFFGWLAQSPTVFTMVYVDNQPAGFVRIDTPEVNGDVGRKCLEFHGGILPEHEGTGLAEMVASVAIDRAFALTGQKKIITKLNEADPKTVALLTRLGFQYKTTDEATGQRIYRIKKES